MAKRKAKKSAPKASAARTQAPSYQERRNPGSDPARQTWPGISPGSRTRALIAPTRREEGCITYDLHRSIAPPDGFLLHEVWATRDHHRSHTKTRHFLRWDAPQRRLLAVAKPLLVADRLTKACALPAYIRL